VSTNAPSKDAGQETQQCTLYTNGRLLATLKQLVEFANSLRQSLPVRQNRYATLLKLQFYVANTTQ
jgi:hypothetical protein